MKTKNPYLNPSLTINELGRQLAISPRRLSQAINEQLKQNFFDLINSYRVEEAKLVMLDSSNDEKNIMQILLDVGFNVKSAFNRAFKKYTGMTPIELRKVLSSERRKKRIEKNS